MAQSEGLSSSRQCEDGHGAQDDGSLVGSTGSTDGPDAIDADDAHSESGFESASALPIRTRIGFSPLATTDEGLKYELGAPPQTSAQRERARGRSMIQELANSQKVADAVGAVDSSSAARRDSVLYERGKPRWPLLQTTVDQLANEQANVDDCHQERSASPVETGGEMIDTPSVSNFPSYGAPDSPTSEQPRSIPRSRRSDLERPSISIIRRGSRRLSSRSGSGSAKSPASMFLSRWSRDPSTARPDPDEEGQTIGDRDEYVIGRQVGYGGFSIVKEVHSFEDGKPVVHAVKIVRKQLVGKSEQENDTLQEHFDHEVSIWRPLKHDHILQLLSVFDSPFAKFCIIPMNYGGTLFDMVRGRRRTASHGSSVMGQKPQPDRTESLLPFPVVRQYLSQLASAIRYLHEDMHIVHRDIKLENCLLTNPNVSEEHGAIGDVLLCDFGMAQHMPADSEDDVFSNEYEGNLDSFTEGDDPHNIGPAEASTNIAGSLQYASPELIRAREPVINPAVDMWAFGVVAFALITTELPFNHPFQPRLVASILNGEWDRDVLEQAATHYSSHTGEPSKIVTGFVENCLAMDVAQRWSIQGVAASELLG